MTQFDPLAALSYGAIGLGFLLAILAYRLLAKEMPRPTDTRTFVGVYAFMIFSAFLVTIGFYSETRRHEHVLLKKYISDAVATSKDLAASLAKVRSDHRDARVIDCATRVGWAMTSLERTATLAGELSSQLAQAQGVLAATPEIGKPN